MIEAFCIGVQMTMDTADAQSTVANLTRDFTSLNQQITQSQSGLAAVRSGLIELAGQQKSLLRDQAAMPPSATWHAAVGLPRFEPTVSVPPLEFAREQGSTDGLAAPSVPESISLSVEGLQPTRRGQNIELDPAVAMWPALATVLSRGDQRFEAFSDLAELKKSAFLNGEAASKWDSRDRSAEISGLRQDDRKVLDEFSARLAGVDGLIGARDLAIDRGGLSELLANVELSNHYERNTKALKYAGELSQSNINHGAGSDVDTTTMFGLAVGATEAARLMTTMSDHTAPGLSLAQPYARMSPPTAAEANIVRAERPATAALRAEDTAAAGDVGSATGASPVVIHTDVHLDGQVVAQAVTQQIVDWMNGPLSGASGFDPRRSYTPVES